MSWHMSDSDERAPEERRPEGPAVELAYHPHLGLLMYGVLAGPVGWAVQFFFSYAAAATLCHGVWAFSFYAVAALSFLLAALGLWIARREWVRAGRPIRTEDAHGPGSTTSDGRIRFLLFGGMFISAFFMVVIVIQTLPIFFLEPCGG